MTEELGPEWKQVYFSEPKTIEELHANFNYWLHLTPDDLDGLDIVLSVALDRDMSGDPIWLYLIAPPGGPKTEFLRALRKYDKTYTIDTLTPQTFISGKVEKDKETGDLYPIAGILEHINGKVLIIKDFTVVLSQPDQARSEIFGQLRAIYDGYFEKAFGTLPDPIRVESKIGLIAAVTPVIDFYSKAHSILGERFLKVRLHPNSADTTKKSYENLGKEEKIRKDLEDSTAYYLKHVRSDIRLSTCQPTGEQKKELVKIARYIALMRTQVISRYFHGRIEDMEYTESETPSRVVKQLKKLAIGLTIIRQHSEVSHEDMKTIKRVAKDCAIPIRQKVVEGLSTFIDKNILPIQLQTATKLPLNTIKNELEKMTLLHIVEESYPLEDKKNIDKEPNTPAAYSFTREFEELRDVVK